MKDELFELLDQKIQRMMCFCWFCRFGVFCDGPLYIVACSVVGQSGQQRQAKHQCIQQGGVVFSGHGGVFLAGVIV
jgi:hypothetical protein